MSQADAKDEEFETVVREEFAFLIEDGFVATAESASSVRFQRGDVFVRVVRDTNDKYVGCRVGTAQRPKDALTLTELATLAGAASPRGEYPERQGELRTSIARVAEQVRRFGARALGGDRSIYDEAMAHRAEYTKRFTRPSP
jgi:hypothetical protein